LGTRYSSTTVATGFGTYLAAPILRQQVEGREDTLSFDEAKSILESCMRVFYYRDARSINKVSFLIYQITCLLFITIDYACEYYGYWCPNQYSLYVGYGLVHCALR
jgi:20S proteasome alpha/beta subunit